MQEVGGDRRGGVSEQQGWESPDGDCCSLDRRGEGSEQAAGPQVPRGQRPVSKEPQQKPRRCPGP